MAGGTLGRCATGVAVDRIPLVPRRTWEGLLDERDLLADRRRRDRLGQKPEAGPVFRLLNPESRLDGRQEIPPSAHVPPVLHRLQPIGIVQGENCGLGEDVGATKTGWML